MQKHEDQDAAETCLLGDEQRVSSLDGDSSRFLSHSSSNFITLGTGCRIALDLRGLTWKSGATKTEDNVRMFRLGRSFLQYHQYHMLCFLFMPDSHCRFLVQELVSRSFYIQALGVTFSRVVPTPIPKKRVIMSSPEFSAIYLELEFELKKE